MEYFKGLASYRGDGRTAITLGKFDGLHRGHQKLIHKVRQLKEAHEVKSVCFTQSMLWSEPISGSGTINAVM